VTDSEKYITDSNKRFSEKKGLILQFFMKINMWEELDCIHGTMLIRNVHWLLAGRRTSRQGYYD